MPDQPVLYLMSPMLLYWTDVLAEAKRYPFEELTGCPVTIDVAEGMFPDTRSWAAAWPALRRRFSFGVFLDLEGWVSRGVWAEVVDLAGLGVPVWWFNGGEPTRWFGFSAPNNRDWRVCYRRVFPVAQPGSEGEGTASLSSEAPSSSLRP